MEEITQPSKPTLRNDSKWSVVNGPRRLDANTVNEVKQACQEALNKNPHLILDLSDTVFLASAGLAMLASLHREASDRKGELRVTNCSNDVQRVIEMVRFDKVLSLYGDLASAAA